MINDEEQLFRALARLPLIAPNVEREICIRKRCCAIIARRISRRAPAGRDLSGTGLLDIAAATALCIYLAVVFTEAVRLGGSL